VQLYLQTPVAGTTALRHTELTPRSRGSLSPFGWHAVFQVKNNIYDLIANLASSFSDQQLDTLFNRFQHLQASI